MYFKQALALAKTIDYPIGAARAYNSLCRTYYLMGMMDESVAACEKAIETTEEYDDPNNMIFADSHTALLVNTMSKNIVSDDSIETKIDKYLFSKTNIR